MNIRKTIIQYFIIAGILLLTPLYSYAGSLISSINFNKTADNKTEIKLNAKGAYRYYVNAQGDNILNIDIKGANISNKMLSMLNTNLVAENGINKIRIIQLNDNSTRISLSVQDIKAFKFLMNAPGGTANPYGFDYNPKETEPKKLMPPMEVKVYEEKTFATNDEEKPAENKEEIKPTNNKHIQKTEKKSVKLSDTKPSEEKNDDIDDDLLTTLSSLPSTNNTQNNDRLNEENVVVPDDFKLSATQNVQPESHKIEEEEKVQEEPSKEPVKSETPKEPEFNLKPIPNDELLSILNSENTDPQNIPRLTATAEGTKNSKEENVPVPNNQQTSESHKKINPSKKVPGSVQQSGSNSIIKISPLPKGKINLNNNQLTTLLPPGSKIITAETSLTNLSEEKSNTTELKEDNTVNLYEPRELNPLPIGLTEEIIYDTPAQPTFVNKGTPKPGLASDGTLAFTIFSSKGVVKGEAQKTSANTDKKIQVIQNKPLNTDNNSEARPKIVDKTKINEFKRIIREAKQLYAAGRLEDAELYFKSAISTDPQQPWGHLALADFYEVQKNYPEAINCYKAASKLLPNKPEILFNIALDYYKLKDYNNAEDYLSRVVNLSPNFTLAYYNLGTLLYKEHKYEDSINNFKKALELNPLLTDAHYNIGLAYLAEQNKNLATKHFDECNNIDSEDQQCKVLLDQYKQ